MVRRPEILVTGKLLNRPRRGAAHRQVRTERVAQDVPRRLSLRLVHGFAAVALALALIGIYGVLSYTVSQRVPEIGVRMALGARRGEIVRMMMASGARLGLIGIAAGVAVSLATSRILNGLLFGVERTDAVTYASVIVLMVVAALLACAIPAMRAARVNPLSAIRAE